MKKILDARVLSHAHLSLLLCMLGAFYLMTFRAGHPWGGDFSVYIHHAKNLVEGMEYRDIGYIYNPRNATLGPASFPPVFPFLLTPIYAKFGLNLSIMKSALVLCFLLSLWIIFLNFRERLSSRKLILFVVLVGYHPYFWNFKDNILSDIPFLLFVYLCLFCFHRLYQAADSTRKQWSYAVLGGLSLYLAYGTRSLGLLLLLCLWGDDIIRRRKISRFTLSITAMLLVLMLLQSKFFHNDRSYLDQFASINIDAMIYNSTLYAKRLSLFLDFGYFRYGRHILFALVSLLALRGFAKQARQNLSVYELFFAGYLALIVIFPFGQTRYLIPVLPLYAFYAIIGLSNMPSLNNPRVRTGGTLVLLAAIVLSYAWQYSRLETGPFPEGIGKAESQHLFETIEELTEKDAIIIFRKPRVLALFTGRQSAVYHQTDTPEELWTYFQSIGATYLISGCLDEDFFLRYVDTWQERLTRIAVNNDFSVYRINP